MLNKYLSPIGKGVSKMNILVRNMVNTSNKTPPNGCNSWKEFWENENGKKFSTCANTSCNKKAEHGSHVREHIEARLGISNVKTYIVPLCAEHNNHNNVEIFNVKEEDAVYNGDMMIYVGGSVIL